MDGAASADDRLPWLADPIPAAPAGSAARLARTPLLVLLGLFLAGVIAVMAFLIGRSMVPDSSPVAVAPDRGAALASADDIAPVPVPPAPIEPPVPPVTTPAVTVPADEVAAAALAPPPVPRTRPVASERQASVRSSAAGDQREQPGAAAVAGRPTAWSERPFAGAAGRVIQVGTFATQGEADAAWWRLARSYPYLGTLPRLVTPTTAPDRPRSYRIRLAAGSRQEALSLCENLHRNRRGCIIDWSQP